MDKTREEKRKGNGEREKEKESNRHKNRTRQNARENYIRANVNSDGHYHQINKTCSCITLKGFILR